MEGSWDRKSKSNKQYFILSGVGHGARRDGHQEKPPGSSLKHSAPPPWAPHNPAPKVPSLLWQMGTHPVSDPFPSLRTSRAALPLSLPPGALAGEQGRRVCVLGKELKVDR